MTEQEIDEKRAMEAVQLLRRSGVGYIYATNALTTNQSRDAQLITRSGSDVEGLVKIALQFAFVRSPELQTFIEEQTDLASDVRIFRPGR